MITIGKLAKLHGLSRSTLLYYDSIGLLKPNGRSANGYRRYADKDAARLESICEYRQAGLSLDDIRRVLDGGASDLETVLAKRLERLGEEIRELREQQRFILGILKEGPHAQVGTLDKAAWTALLASCGLSESDMMNWHARFERFAPQEHARFLAFLNIPRDEIESIRKRSRARRVTQAR